MVLRIIKLTENGFLIISFLIILSVIVGIFVVGLKMFKGTISGKKTMFFGAELILLGYIFATITDFKVIFPNLSFITILLGVMISVVGLSKLES